MTAWPLKNCTGLKKLALARFPGVPSSNIDLVVKPKVGATTSTMPPSSLIMTVGRLSGNGLVFGCVANGPRGSESKLATKMEKRTARLNARVATCAGTLESETRTLKLKSPTVVGVPKRTPALLKLRPGGKTDPGATCHVSGAIPPDAFTCCV